MVRKEITTFVREADAWRHENVLIDTSRVPALLAECGVQATVADAFGDERLPSGLMAIVGRRVA